MVTKIFEIAVDLKRPPSNREFELVEGDTGNVFHITLTDGGEAVDLTGCRVVAVFAKTGGTTMQDSGVEGNGVTVVGNNITVELRKESYGVGTTECELQVYSGELQDTLVTTARFNFSARKAFFNEDTAQSTNEYPILVQLITDANEAAQKATEAAGLVQSAADNATKAVADAQTAVAAATALNEQVSSAETARESAEAARDSAESERVAAEAQRNANESARVAAESARASSESERDSAEAAREAAEAGRVAAELERANSVRYIEQSLTDSQKSQARTNISAAAIDANGKVVADQATSARGTNVTASRNLTEDDNGKLLLALSADVTITVPSGLPLGMEVEVCRWNSNTVTFAAGDGVSIKSVNSALSIANQYGCAVLKKATTDDIWILAGDLA